MVQSQVLTDLAKALVKFQECVKKDVAEVRKAKEEIQAVQNSTFNIADGVYFLRDSNTLVLSAPRVVIGNVDADGRLIGGGEVILRGHDIKLEASGDPATGGSIVSRAASIRNIAVDPGKDGLENVVCQVRSEIINQSRAITLQSNDELGAFTSAAPTGIPGINILSETFVDVKATPSASQKSTKTNLRKAALEQQITASENKILDFGNSVADLIKEVTFLVNDQLKINDNATDLCFDYQKLHDLQGDFDATQKALAKEVSDYIAEVSNLAELHRQKKALEETRKAADDKKANFAKDTTNSRISMVTETFSFESKDGDGNIRENKEAGMNINVPHLTVTADDKDRKVIKDSSIDFKTQDLRIDTGNPTYKGETKKEADVAAAGSVTISSQKVTIEAVDNKLSEYTKYEEDKLAAQGKIMLRAMEVVNSCVDKDGKSNGKCRIMAKDMFIGACDLDDKRKFQDLAVGSSLTLFGEKTVVGDSEKTQTLALQAAETNVSVKTKATIVHSGEQAGITVSDGKIEIAANSVDLNAKQTKIAGEAEIGSISKCAKATIDEIEATKALKSPNINDTQGAGVAVKPGSIHVDYNDIKPADSEALKKISQDDDKK